MPPGRWSASTRSQFSFSTKFEHRCQRRQGCRGYDYEYSREGTANLFVFLDAKRPWRHVKTTEQRTSVDFAHCMKDLVDVHYVGAAKIRVVMDNLSTHKAAALYDVFDAIEARRILRKLEFHYTPKHGSWLNMVEVENGVIQTQCLDRRIPNIAMLRSETTAWATARNSEAAAVKWRFTVEDARVKMANAYPARPTPFARAAPKGALHLRAISTEKCGGQAPALRPNQPRPSPFGRALFAA